MKKIMTGIGLGVIAGVLDVIPMILQKLTWDANISAFSMWVVSGFLMAVTDIRVNPVLKGILVPLLVMTPCVVLIGWKEPVSLIPIGIMTIIIGSLLGYSFNKLSK